MGTRTKKKANPIYKYYQAIKNGSVTVGEYIERLYEIIVKGLEEGKYTYDAAKANAAIEWMENHVFHTEGPLAPGLLKLELWQQAILACMYGIVDKNGHRQFREVLLIVARKNGKSLFASGIAKYDWFVNGGFGARVYNIAPKLDQADIIYNNVWMMTTLDPEWQERKRNLEADKKAKVRYDDPELARHRMTDLYIPATNGMVKKIAFSAKKSDGFNPSLCICDEIASWEGDKGLRQYEVMKSGMGARPEPILFSCSTAGYINGSIYDELMARATRFLKGDSKETRLLPFIYMVDDPSKWNDIDELAKANPQLGKSVSVDYLLEEIAVAETSLSKQREFLAKYCNVKQNASRAWLDSGQIEQCFGAPLRLEDFERTYCVGGIDLSRSGDLTACTAVIEREQKLYVFAQFFLPGAVIEEATARDGVPYDIYIKRGLLKISGENFIDYHDCYNWFVELIEQYRIYPLQIGYDRNMARYLVQDLEAYGFMCDDVFQGENLTPVINEFEGQVKDGTIICGDNDLLKIHFYNSALKENVESNRRRLVKMAASQHIDGMAALLDAMTVRQKWHDEIGHRLKNTRN